MNSIGKILIQQTLCGIVFFISALLCSVMIFGLFPKNDYLVMAIAAPFSAAFIGTVSWTIFTSFGKRINIWKGIVTGILAGSVSHYLTWYASIIVLYLQKSVSSLGEPTVGPIDGIWASLIMTFFSLAVIGWITIPLGAAIGGLFAAFSKRFLSEQLK